VIALCTIRRFPAFPALDLGFATGLLLLCAIPLILLHGSTWLHNRSILAATFVVSLGWIALWTRATRRTAHADTLETMSPAVVPDVRESGLVLAIPLLSALVIVAFFLPLRLQFWGGVDEIANFVGEGARMWSDLWDSHLGRPLLGVPSFLGLLLTPDRIDGLLYVAVVLCFANGILVMAIVRRMVPAATLVAVAAATLFIVNRGEPLIFRVAWTTNFYWMALFCYLLALYLLLVSHSHGSRWLLSVSCASLGAALLMREGLFPLSLLAPLLLYIRGGDRGRLVVWSSIWLGTVALFAARFAIYLHASETYQERLLTGTHSYHLLQNAAEMVLTMRAYFVLPESLFDHDVAWMVAFALAFGAVAAAKNFGPRIDPRACLFGMAASGLANVLAILPFLPMSTMWRTQYFAAPAQAAFLAFGLALVGSLMSRQLGRFAVATATALIAANVTAQSFNNQQISGPVIRFERTVHVFEQVHAVSPNLPQDTLLLFVLDAGVNPPLGVNYHVFYLSRYVLGVSALQANYADPNGIVPSFGKDGVWVSRIRGGAHYRYDQIIAFRLSADGTIMLLGELPEILLPDPTVGRAYAPLARLRPGPIETLRFLRYLPWSEPGLDVFDFGSGVIFGDNWGARVEMAGQIGRWADNDAELIVNPTGRDRIELRFDIEPGREFERLDSELTVLNDGGEVLARAGLNGLRQRVLLDVPLDSPQVARLRLRIRQWPDAQQDPPLGSFLILRPEVRATPTWQMPSPDIVDPDSRLHLGNGWHAPERQGGDLFRWIQNGAEILVDAAPGRYARLALEVEAGPSFGGRPAPLQVLADDGRVLASTEVLGRRTLEIELPPAPQRWRRLRLHADGGGLAVPGDPRILDFRVFRVGRPARTPDIVQAGDQVRLGGGWHALETEAGQLFRWVENDAELLVSAAAGEPVRLALEVEAGPSFGGRPAPLQVLADDGRVLASTEVLGRRTLEIGLPPAPERWRRLRLHADGGGLAVPGDPRIQNFRVFRAGRPARTSDIVQAGDQVRLGGGWHALETEAGQLFRWVENDAELLVSAAAGEPVRLALEVEAGPSFGGRPAPLQVLADDGRVLASTEVLGRRTVEIELPPAPTTQRTLRLHTEGGGLAVPGDPRILNFRVFRCWRSTG
jgi:hypothetical protein